MIGAIAPASFNGLDVAGSYGPAWIKRQMRVSQLRIGDSAAI
jgi:hypothetical protein